MTDEPTTYFALPAHMRPGARRYIENRIAPGSFLLAVLRNDFADAIFRADAVNRRALRGFARWLRDECPPEAWGSREAVSNWLKGPKE